jgi:hypothetical protein
MVLLTLAFSLEAPELPEAEIDRLVAELERTIIEHGQ